jgi:Tol biopolymer transport system component
MKHKPIETGITCVLLVLLIMAFPMAVGPLEGLAAPGDIARVSTTAGGEPANNTVYDPTISSDGRYVVFSSIATNLGVDPGGNLQIFRKDLSTGEIVCCSTSTGGAVGNSSSAYPAVSADGRYVAFQSYSSNFGVNPGGWRQAFRKDLSSGAIACCSTTAEGAVADTDIDSPCISPDGRYVGFDSLASNLGVPWGGRNQVYLKDLSSGAIACCSTNASGVAGDSHSSSGASLSSGQYVAFSSYAGNLSGNPGGTDQIFRKDLLSGAVVMCSTSAGGAVGNDQSYAAVITPDGRYIGFASDATNLGVNPGGESQLYRKDMSGGGVSCCTTSATGEVANVGSGVLSMTSDGRYVVFTSGATNLGVNMGIYAQILRKDLSTGQVICCSTNVSGEISNVGSENAAISSNGQYVAFLSASSNLIPDSGSSWQVFRKETDASPPPPPGPTSRTWGTDSIGVSQPATDWYLAEGCTAGDFETWVLVQNPNSQPASIQVTYMTSSGPVAGPAETLPANSRKSYNVASTVPDSWEVSTKVHANRPVIAERAMYGNGRQWGHDSVGASAPKQTWYLAEGCTAAGFETWVLVQNPGSVPAPVRLTYMTGAGPVAGPAETLPPNSRKTYNVASTVPDSWEVSTKVDADQPVVAERAMYNTERTWGHDSVGVWQPATTWFLAEGCTASGFEDWLLVQNPDDEPASVTITYMTSSGAVAGPVETLAPNTRKTYNVASSVPDAWDVSAQVGSSKAVVAERAMYGNGRTWAHDSIGASTPAPDWYLAEGCTAAGFETWVLVQNPNAAPTDIAITYMTPAGQVAGPEETLPAFSRKSYNVAVSCPNTSEVSTKVHSSSTVIAERSMYGDPR